MIWPRGGRAVTNRNGSCYLNHGSCFPPMQGYTVTVSSSQPVATGEFESDDDDGDDADDDDDGAAMVDVVVMKKKEQNTHCKRIDARDELEMTTNMQLVDCLACVFAVHAAGHRFAVCEEQHSHQVQDRAAAPPMVAKCTSVSLLNKEALCSWKTLRLRCADVSPGLKPPLHLFM